MQSRIIIIAPNHIFPRLAGIADDAAALRLHFAKRELSDVAIHTETLAHRGGRLPQSRPAAEPVRE
jgi:hypothetical protein